MTHPVDDLGHRDFDARAREAADDLRCRYSALVTLEPGDATHYQISIVASAPPRRYYVASNFGALYEWNPTEAVHWDYVASHFLDEPHEWTARILTRFLNTLREQMKGGAT
jgi:hypothetical protein